jgi:hypothetical protein
MGHLRRLIESRPFLSRVPDQSLLACDPGEGNDHLQATRGDGYAMVYSPNGRSFKIHLDRLPGKTLRASWFDPRNGSSKLTGEFTKQGDREFDPPGEPAVGNDWVLLLDDADRSPASGGVSEERDSARQYESGGHLIGSLAVDKPIRCEGVDHAGRFIVVGGLPPGIEENYAYEYDLDFKFVRKHTLQSGYTLMGIQTATYSDGNWWFGCYGKPETLLKTDEAFTLAGKYEFNGSLGIVGQADGSFLVARGTSEPGKGHTATIFIADANAKKGLAIRERPLR